MAPIAKEQDTLSSALASAGVTLPAVSKPQPAAVEIPVTVNGARTVEGSDKREPFSENTQTVLVFANGAVIWLASAVASGQLLFLTNDRTKKEVVCQVVKSKNYSRESGYVELEFTESAPGFWGMRFPAAGVAAAAPVAAKLAAPVTSLPEKSQPEKLAEEQAKKQTVAVVEPVKTAKVKPVEVAEPAKESVVLPVVAAEESVAPPAVAASPLRSPQERLIEATTKAEILPRVEDPKAANFKTVPVLEPAESATKIPTLSEFLTSGAKGPELKAPEKEKSAALEQDANADSQRVSEGSTAPQEQLSSLIFQKKGGTFAVEKKPAGESDSNAGLLTRLLVPEKVESITNAPPAMKANPAPGTSTFDFSSEEVRIPAWLEPLAKNSAASAAVFETKARETKTNDVNFGENNADRSDNHEPGEHAPSVVENGPEYSEKHEAVLTLSSEGPTPNFGSSLALDSRAAKPEDAGKSRKGLLLVLLVVGLLLAAAAAWYWYTNQPQSVSANGIAAPEEISGTTAAAGTTTPISRTAATPAANLTANATSNHNSVTAAPAKGDSNGFASSVERAAEPADSTIETTRKPTLGEVHLAAPLVNHAAQSTENGGAEAAPTLNESGEAGGDPGSLGLLGSKGKQPPAPLVVGGDVKQARLISSVAPVYPQLARNQRLSGDVVIDALVDVHGNVSTMKVISGPPMLHQTAMDALRQWKYQPATLNGQPMAMHLSVTVQFKLQ